MRKDLVAKKQRYSVYRFDKSTFVVADDIAEREICICADHENYKDAEQRAQKIAALLNESQGENLFL